MTTIRTHADVALGLTGSGAVLAAVTILAGWPWALLTAGIALVALAMVVT